MGEERRQARLRSRSRSRSRSESASLFSSQPRSFKMDVRSPQAARLKASVTQKLMGFLGCYADDVLAEYIVVLVCNGKNQNQARDDLEAFLGDRSAEFITWLWHHLSEEKPSSRSPVLKADSTVASSSDADKECKIGRIASPQIHSGGTSHGLLAMDSKAEPSSPCPSRSSSPVIDTSEDLQRWNPDSNGPLTGDNVQESQPQKCTVHRTSDTVGDHQNEARYSAVRSSSEILAGDELGLRFQNHFKKTARSKSIEEPHHLSPSPKCLPVSRNFQSVGTEDPYSKLAYMAENAPSKLSSKAMDAAPRQSIKRRGSVWDRLGKPCEDSEQIMDAKDISHDEGRKMDIAGKELEQHRSAQCLSGPTPIRRVMGERAANDKIVAKSVSNSDTDECYPSGRVISVMDSINNSSSFRRKRDFVEVGHGNMSASSSGHGGNDFQDKETPKRILRSSSVRSSQIESLVELTAHPTAACHSMEAANVGSHPQPTKRSEPWLKKEASDFNSAETHAPIQRLTKPNPLSFTAENNHHGPGQSEILDMKIKLQQVEMEMLKLRAKQAKMSNDSKPFTGLASTKQGVQNLFEDVESRTIFVTNVHFAATKEDLSLHFAKYGAIVNVVLLTDTLTGLPKGSAYIVFSSRDSAENALSLSGTSFFSRVVRVMRKADMPGTPAEPKQPSGKPPQPWYPQSLKKGTFQRQYSGSHLQWRRDQPANGETSSTAA